MDEPKKTEIKGLWIAFIILAAGFVVVCGLLIRREIIRSNALKNMDRNVIEAPIGKDSGIIKASEASTDGGMDQATANNIMTNIVSFYKTYGQHATPIDGVTQFFKISPNLKLPEDYDIFSQSQDPYDSYAVSVKPSAKHKNAFDISWDETDWQGKQRVNKLTWIFISQNGDWVLSEVLDNPSHFE